MVLLGNMASLVGCIMMVAIGLVKKKENILTIQCIQYTFMGLANLALGATAGLISNSLSIVRNLVFTRVSSSTGMKVLFIILQTALTLLTAGTALIEWIPVTAVVIYTWCLDVKSDVVFKLIIIGTTLMWMAYDLYYRNYASFVFGLMTVISTVVGIWMLKKEK